MAKKGRRAARAETSQATPIDSKRATRWSVAFFVLLAAAFAAKAAVLAHFYDHPLLQPSSDDLDSAVYARLAAHVAGGDVLLRGEGAVPYFVSPLYVYFLALVHVVSGGSLLAVRTIQILLGTAAAGLVFVTARRLFGARAAVFAGAFYALTGVVTFHEILILQAALDPFLTALFLYLLAVGLTPEGISSKVSEAEVAATGGPKLWPTFLAGAAGGLLALNRPNALLCVAAIALALTAAELVARRGSGQPLFPFKEVSLRALLPALALVAGALLTIAPFTLRNFVVSHELVLISSHGGLNFLVGNGPDANGAYHALPGITPDIGGQARDAKKVAEAAEGRELSTRQVSSHFAREAVRWIRANPGAAFSLFLRKVRFSLSGDEAPLNFSYPWYRGRSMDLKLLAVGPGLLVPLAGAGLILAVLALAGPARGRILVWAAFAPAYVCAVALFFVATRYRLPLLVALAPLAGAAIAAIPGPRRTGRTRGIAGAGLVAAVLAAVSLWPTGLYDGAADEDMQWALYLVEKGDVAEVARVAEAAAPRHPDPGLMWFRIGRAFAAVKRTDESIAALEKARAIERHPAETDAALAAEHEARGVDRILARDALAALPDFEAAVALAPEDPGMLLNLAAVLAEKGDRDRARDLVKKCLALRPGYAKAEALAAALK